MTGRLFVIGDIHGCARELERLLDGLPLAAGDTLACVGDYIDRGPEPRAVIDMLLGLKERSGLGTVFLKGNHEDMCLGYLGRGGSWGEAWCMNGGATTLRSYGVDSAAPGSEASASFPAAHLDFLGSLVTSHIAGDHLLVHAGVDPDLPWARQDPEDLLWIRDQFIGRPHVLPQTIVFGHTPQRQVLVDLPYKIGIDTGCVYGGMLTCLEVRERVLYQVRLGDHRVRQSTLPTPARRRWA